MEIQFLKIQSKKVKSYSSILLWFFPELCSERYMTLNMHALQCVRDSGPLWVTSCFSFESANGELTKLFHGTQNVECQIVASVNIIQNLPVFWICKENA